MPNISSNFLSSFVFSFGFGFSPLKSEFPMLTNSPKFSFLAYIGSYVCLSHSFLCKSSSCCIIPFVILSVNLSAPSSSFSSWGLSSRFFPLGFGLLSSPSLFPGLRSAKDPPRPKRLAPSGRGALLPGARGPRVRRRFVGAFTRVPGGGGGRRLTNGREGVFVCDSTVVVVCSVEEVVRPRFWRRRKAI